LHLEFRLSITHNIFVRFQHLLQVAKATMHHNEGDNASMSFRGACGGSVITKVAELLL